jgi:hypothetical protein
VRERVGVASVLALALSVAHFVVWVVHIQSHLRSKNAALVLCEMDSAPKPASKMLWNVNLGDIPLVG